jgi:hypothetical protein
MPGSTCSAAKLICEKEKPETGHWFQTSSGRIVDRVSTGTCETPVAFTNTRWLTPIDRTRPDLYLYSPKGAPHTKTSMRARYNRWLKTEDWKLLCKKWQEWVGQQARKYQWDMDEEDWKHPTIHGLRGTGILLRRGRGCNNEQISNDIGMSIPIVGRYMRFKDEVAAAEAGRLEPIEGSGP